MNPTYQVHLGQWQDITNGSGLPCQLDDEPEFAICDLAPEAIKRVVPCRDQFLDFFTLFPFPGKYLVFIKARSLRRHARLSSQSRPYRASSVMRRMPCTQI